MSEHIKASETGLQVPSHPVAPVNLPHGPHHVTSPTVYLIIFAILLALTLLTWATAESHIGMWHTLVALTIAISKALLVVLFFMHALHSNKLSLMTIMVSLFMIFVMIALTLVEYLSCAWASV